VRAALSARVCVCACACAFMCRCVCLCLCLCVREFVLARAYVCLRAFVCVCLCVYLPECARRRREGGQMYGALLTVLDRHPLRRRSDSFKNVLKYVRTAMHDDKAVVKRLVAPVPAAKAPSIAIVIDDIENLGMRGDNDDHDDDDAPEGGDGDRDGDGGAAHGSGR
jgi:hypothetical protein